MRRTPVHPPAALPPANLPPAHNPLDPGYGAQDAMARGLGVAARSIALTTDVYCPRGVSAPLVPGNRMVRLHAAFTGADIGFKRSNGYGDAVWFGLFDTAYTKPGDYLVQNDTIWFVAAQPPLMPALVVRADRTVTFSRAPAPKLTGVNDYGGVTRANAVPVLTCWPASITGIHRGPDPEAKLPGDTMEAQWTVLLPGASGAVLLMGDLMRDDLGRDGVVRVPNSASSAGACWSARPRRDMADQSDVETALTALVTAALYPNGAAFASVCGADCRVFRGWPSPAALGADLAAGRVNVTIYPANAGARATTRFTDIWHMLPGAAPSLGVTVDGLTATFIGSGATGLLAGIAAEGRSYVYASQPTDSAELVAASLGALASANLFVQVQGATLTVPGATSLIARTAMARQAMRELRRQRQDFRISCWCPDFATRDVVGAAIDVALSQLLFIDLADGTQARLTYASNTVLDRAEDTGLYRRDLVYTAEYATVLFQTQPTMLFNDGSINSIFRFIG